MSNRLFKSLLVPLFVGFVLLFYAFNAKITTPLLPVAGQPPQLYSNQTNDDLRNTFTAAIHEAKESILLIIYTLTDEEIIQALCQKSAEKVKIKVIYNVKDAKDLSLRLSPNIEIIPRKPYGIMHQKILVIDNRLVWLGSANMTNDSLRMHGNLVVGVHSPEIAAAIQQIAHQLETSLEPPRKYLHEFVIAGQKIELWHLPSKKGSTRIIKLLSQAQKTIKIAMFTWSNQALAQAVINAHKRGVAVSVVLDRHSSQGASIKVAKMLSDAGISIKVQTGIGLLHHKFAYIDGKQLINGSTNWTKAAFTINDDCFMILHDLTKSQKKKIDAVWNVVSTEATVYKEK